MLAYARRTDGAIVSFALQIEETDYGFKAMLPAHALGGGIETVDFLPDYAAARARQNAKRIFHSG